MTEDFATAERYVRGELAEPELQAFEERLLADERLAMIAAAAEEELLDAYAAGVLRGAARARVAARLAVDPALRSQLAVTRGLARRGLARGAPAAAPAPPRRRWWWLAVPALAAAAATAVLVLRSDPPAPRAPEVVVVALAAPTRSSLVPEVRIPDGAQTLRLVLDCACDRGGAAELRGPGGRVPVRTPAAPEGGLVVEVDADRLGAGLHELIVTAGAELVASYQLRVVPWPG